MHAAVTGVVCHRDGSGSAYVEKQYACQHQIRIFRARQCSAGGHRGDPRADRDRGMSLRTDVVASAANAGRVPRETRRS